MKILKLDMIEILKLDLIEICLRTCDMNSSLGSVVPLAMFKNNIRAFTSTACYIVDTFLEVSLSFCCLDYPLCI